MMPGLSAFSEDGAFYSRNRWLYAAHPREQGKPQFIELARVPFLQAASQ